MAGMMGSGIPLQVILTLVDQLSQPFKKAAGDVEKSSGTLKNATGDMGKGFSKVFDGIAQGIGMAAGQFLLQTPRMIGELVELGGQAEVAEYRFTQFAGGTQQATGYLAAFQTATDGTVTKMAAMEGASRLLQMGLVGNADEMGQVAAMATKLGDQTIGASERLSGFAALLANQSIPRLDNYGISSGKVRERIKELQDATADMSREEAFKIAVMEEGAKALATLGDTSELTSTKIARIKVAIEEFKLGLAEMAATAAASLLDLEASSKAFADAEAAHWSGKDAIEAYDNSLKQAAVSQAEMTSEAARWAEMGGDVSARTDAINQRFAEQEQALRDAEMAMQDARVATHDASLAVGSWEQSLDTSVTATDNAVSAWETMKLSAEDLNSATAVLADEYAEKMQQLREATMNAALDMGMSWKSFYDKQAEDASGWVEKETEIHAGHEERLAEIRRSGQATAIQIDAEAEEAKLALLQEKLAIALQQQTEFTDKTKESSRMAKELQIEQLQGQIGEQEALLGAHYEGRLVQQGANISAELAAEQERYNQELATMQAAQAEQEAAQRESLGRMVLQQFDSWASMNEISGTQAVEMRMAIMQEYGLIDQESMNVVNSMLGHWDAWAAGTAGSASDVIGSMDNVIAGQGKMVAAHETDISDMVKAEETGYGDRVSTADVSLSEMMAAESTYYSDKLGLQDTSLSDEAAADETFFSDKLSLQDTSLAESMTGEEVYYTDLLSLQDTSLASEMAADEAFFNEKLGLQDTSLNESVRGFESYFSELISLQSQNHDAMMRAEEMRHAQQLSDEQATLDALFDMTDTAWTDISNVVDDKTADMQGYVEDSHSAIQNAVDTTTMEMENDWSRASDNVKGRIDAMIAEIDQLVAKLDAIPRQIDVDIFIHVHGTAPEEEEDPVVALGNWGHGLPSIRERMEEETRTGMAHQGMMMSWSDFFERRAELAAESAADLQGLEAEHQARMTELMAQGNAQAIAAEQARYAEELAMMQASQAAQEAAQREALGRMVLQQFDAYASMTDMTGERMLEMRMAIMEQYGLIDQASIDTVNAMLEYWEGWRLGVSADAADYISGLDDIIDQQGDMVNVQGDALDDMADATAESYGAQTAAQEAAMATMAAAGSDHYSTMLNMTEGSYGDMQDVVDDSMMNMQAGWTDTSDHVGDNVDDITYEISRLNAALDSIRTDIDISVGFTAPTVPGYQHGTVYHPGGLALVGEAGPELAWLPAGARVFPSYDPRSMAAARAAPPGASAGPALPIVNIWGPVHIHGVQDPINLLEEIQALTI